MIDSGQSVRALVCPQPRHQGVCGSLARSMAISTATVRLGVERAGHVPMLLTTTVAAFILACWIQITLHPGWGRHMGGGGFWRGKGT